MHQSNVIQIRNYYDDHIKTDRGKQNKARPDCLWPRIQRDTWTVELLNLDRHR